MKMIHFRAVLHWKSLCLIGSADDTYSAINGNNGFRWRKVLFEKHALLLLMHKPFLILLIT